MLTLGIETSCDETSASILEIINNRINLLSNVVASSLSLHAKTGGIIPETAAREQLLYIMPVIKESFDKAGFKFQNFPVDNIAVTYGPGLIGSLLVGIETARTLSYIFKKPLIPVNHLLGHIYANWIERDFEEIRLPAVALIVSGGHTDLLLIKSHKNIKWLGGTRDDAAGEAFDKIGRLLNLPYPAGPIIEKLAKNGNPRAFDFPRPLIHSKDFDFSFSGLKTAVLRSVSQIDTLDDKTIRDVSASAQAAISEVLVVKTLNAAKQHKAKSLLLGGGVAANGKIRGDFEKKLRDVNLMTNLLIPEKNLCTDNAAMIATASYFVGTPIPWRKIDAVPSLRF